jgi:hypothetical protein
LAGPVAAAAVLACHEEGPVFASTVGGGPGRPEVLNREREEEHGECQRYEEESEDETEPVASTHKVWLDRPEEVGQPKERLEPAQGLAAPATASAHDDSVGAGQAGRKWPTRTAPSWDACSISSSAEAWTAPSCQAEMSS